MNVIIDRLLLLASCCFTLNYNENMNLSLTIILVAMAISEFNLAFQKKWFHHISTVGYLILCAFNPEFICLLPLVLYDSILKGFYPYLGLGIVEAVFYFGNLQLFYKFYIIFLFVFVVILAVRTRYVEKLHREYLDFKDDSKELEMVMEARNREIQLNQDNQIHLATLEERNRIAREIHDNVGHMLSRSILMVGASLAINKDDNMNECLTELKSTLDQAMNSIRSSVHDLHDDSIDLELSVKQIVEQFTFCKMMLDYDMGHHVERKVKLCFLAILKEAGTNIVKHSNATKVEVVMREHPGMYQLLIHDNGTLEKNKTTDGIGLSNMQERVKGLKGTITITQEKGYRIFVMIPKSKTEQGVNHENPNS